jgi:hypothetical protein
VVRTIDLGTTSCAIDASTVLRTGAALDLSFCLSCFAIGYSIHLSGRIAAVEPWAVTGPMQALTGLMFLEDWTQTIFNA